MIWLNKILRDIDNFYSLANSSDGLSKIADEAEEKRKRREERFKQFEKEFEKKKEEASKLTDVQKQQAKTRATLQKVNAWEFNDPQLFELFDLFQQNYNEVFTRISQFDPDIIGDIRIGKIKELDDLDDMQENATQLAGALNSLKQRLATLARYLMPYMENPDTEDWLENDPEKGEDPESGMKGYFTAEEFIDTVNQMMEDAENSTQLALGKDVDLTEAAAADLAMDANRTQGNMTGDDKLTQTGDKIQQMLAAVRKHKSNLRKAAKFGETDPFWESLMKHKASRKRYDENLKKDPTRLEHSKEQAQKRWATFKQMKTQRETLLLALDLATDPREKENIKSRIKDLEYKIQERMGKFKYREEWGQYEMEFEKADHEKALRERMQKRQEALQAAHLKEVQKIQKGKETRSFADIIVLLQHKLSDRKRGAKKYMKDETIQNEDHFAPYKSAIANAVDKLNASVSALNQAEAKTQLNNAQQALAQAIINYKDNHPQVKTVTEQCALLYSFRDMINNLLSNGIIADNISDISQMSEQEVIGAISTGQQLIDQYVGQYKRDAAILLAEEIMTKIKTIFGINATPEVPTNE